MSEDVIAAAAVRVSTMADGTLRLTVDVEPAQAQAAFALFGRPGAPMALAALVEGYAAITDEPRLTPKPTPQDAPAKPKGGPLSMLAGRWCADPGFQEWVRPVYDRMLGGKGLGWGDLGPTGAAELGAAGFARHAILVACDILSRAELDHNPLAADSFNQRIREPYMRHLANR